MASAEDLARLLRLQSPRSSNDLQTALKISRATLSRFAAALHPTVVRVGKTRAVQYLAARAVEGVGRQVELFAVNPNGAVSLFARMHLQFGEGAVIEYASGRVTAHPGVPWFLDDARPQGFLGSVFLRAHPELHLPPLDRWRADDTIRALALSGEDLWGNILAGAASVERFQSLPQTAITRAKRKTHYPALADRVLAGELPGSSAGGEQPKFTAVVGADAVIVKFSPRQRDGQRWRDLLFCEKIAADVLRERDLPCAESDIVEADGRVFLEVKRFDRVGLRGRRAVITMGPVDAEFIGHSTQTWSNVAHALVEQKRLSQKDAATAYRLDAFARLIFNSDRHLGNLALFWDDGDTFRLAPAYDMLPMAFRPSTHGLSPNITPPTFDARTVSVWEEMKPVAVDYWHRVLSSPELSPAFKKSCAKPALAAISA